MKLPAAIAALCLLLPLLAAADPPEPPAAAIELDGTFQPEGAAAPERFWARLLPADQRYGGHRLLQLVYEPPRPEALDGTVLVDCPFVLLDSRLRLVAWNGRNGLSQVTPAKDGYQVTREVLVGEGHDARPEAREARLPGARAWDRRLAPLLLALAWRPDSEAQVRTVDFFGPRPPADLAWKGGEVSFDGAVCRVEAGADGRLGRLLASDGRAIIVVAARTSPK